MTPADSKRDATASELVSGYIANLADWRGDMLARIRAIFHEAHPGIIEEWKWKGSPVWSHQGQIAVANAHREKVKLTFSQGAHLPDPKKLFNAGLDGNQWRAIDIFREDTLNDSALKKLIQAAVRYNVSGTP
ncbi:MAG: DUF1801 domain-containing protein [Deltaproteobacteria bacterium]|nr:DUF1801 domain-containing protein [Deltaproteobacteria bacterium]